jgi:hypothetical protein
MLHTFKCKIPKLVEIHPRHPLDIARMMQNTFEIETITKEKQHH